MSIFEITGNETLETLLPRSVPKLQPDYLPPCCDVFTDEIDTDRRLTQSKYTFLVGSNSFRIYLAMMELFPTFWSPTKTILNFWIEFRLLEKLILSLILYNPTNIKSNYQIQYLAKTFLNFAKHFFKASLLFSQQKQYASIMTQNKNTQKKDNENLSQFNKYLDNNIDILRQKFIEYYGEPFPLQDLNSTEELQYTIKYIYDIFNFNKYESNPSLNKTLRNSLTDNIKAFFDIQIKSHQVFDSQLAIKLLRYCIQHNEMFAVHYDKKKTQKKPQEQEASNSNPTQEANKVQTENKQKVLPQQQLSEDKGQELVHSAPANQDKKSQISNENQPMIEEKSFDEMNIVNQFQASRSHARDQNIQLIKKQLKGVFEFYCKQTQSISPNCTFDNINHKCQTMNIGKFMTFAMTMNLIHTKQKVYSEGKLDKRMVIGIFKKIAQGRSQIDFTVFYTLMEELKKIDNDIYTRIGLGQEGAKGRNKVQQRLKCVSKPFSTRDLEGREKLQNRLFVSKLTGHSGKYEDALRDQLVSRRQRAKLDPIERARLESKLSANSNKKMTPGSQEKPDRTKFTLKLGKSNENFQNQDLKFISKLISQEQNDQVFLKDYRLPSKKGADHQNTHNKSYDDSRYKQQTKLGSPFIANSGVLTSRGPKRQDFILPSISNRGRYTQLTTQRRSLGVVKNIGQRTLINR